MNIFEKVLIHHGSDTLDKTVSLHPEKRISWYKPDKGLWASPELDDHLSVWTKWCEEENYSHNGVSLDKYFKFKISKAARVCVINTMDDLKALVRKCPGTEETGRASVGWILCPLEYDVIYLTDEGQWNTRLTYPSLYGWDMESCVIFNYDVIEIIK